MSERFEVELTLSHKGKMTIVTIHKQDFMDKNFLDHVLKSLHDAEIGKSVYFKDGDPLSETYVICLSQQTVDDDDLIDCLYGSIHDYLSSATNELADTMSKSVKFGLSPDATNFLKNLGNSLPKAKESKVDNYENPFHFPDDAPEYVTELGLCPKLALKVCSEIIFDTYKGYLQTVAFEKADLEGDYESRDLLILVKTLIDMAQEFRKYMISCTSCPLRSTCDYNPKN